MEKQHLDKLVLLLKENSIEFKLDTYINRGKGFLRGIFVYRENAGNDLRKLLEKNIPDSFKLRKSYSWYLGERKRTLVLRPKEELELEIPEIEQYQVNNYA